MWPVSVGAEQLQCLGSTFVQPAAKALPLCYPEDWPFVTEAHRWILS